MGDLIKFSERELELIGSCDDPWQSAICQNIMDIVKLFDSQGHSGFTASYTLGIIDRLLRWLPLRPLTGEELEWGTEASKDQNNRCFHVFRREDGTAYDTEGKIFTEDNGETWFTNADSFVDITFPYNPPTIPEKVFLKKEKHDSSE